MQPWLLGGLCLAASGPELSPSRLAGGSIAAVLSAKSCGGLACYNSFVVTDHSMLTRFTDWCLAASSDISSNTVVGRLEKTSLNCRGWASDPCSAAPLAAMASAGKHPRLYGGAAPALVGGAAVCGGSGGGGGGGGGGSRGAAWITQLTSRLHNARVNSQQQAVRALPQPSRDGLASVELWAINVHFWVNQDAHQRAMLCQTNAQLCRACPSARRRHHSALPACKILLRSIRSSVNDGSPPADATMPAHSTP